jgi:hypothetical protein
MGTITKHPRKDEKNYTEFLIKEKSLQALKLMSNTVIKSKDNNLMVINKNVRNDNRFRKYNIPYSLKGYELKRAINEAIKAKTLNN